MVVFYMYMCIYIYIYICMYVYVYGGMQFWINTTCLLICSLCSLRCKRCIIVGNGGILSNKSLGSHIDEYDVVIRWVSSKSPCSAFLMTKSNWTNKRILDANAADLHWLSVYLFFRLNEAPVSGYSRDVGTKTTLRITYPEGAIQKTERYEKDSLFVFSAFKPLDFKWLRQMVFREKLVRSNAVVCDYTVLFLSLKSVEIVLFVLFLRSLILKQN